MPAERRIQRSICTRNVPVHPHPQMHARQDAHIAGEARQQRVSAALLLRDSANAVILGVRPCEFGPNKPFPLPVFCFIRSIRKPEARFKVTARSEEHTSELQSHSFISYAV